MLGADNPGLIDLSWVRDDSINILEDVTVLHQHTLHLLSALIQVAEFPLRNSDLHGPMTLLTTTPGKRGTVLHLTMRGRGCMRTQFFRAFRCAGRTLCKKYSWLCCLMEPEGNLLAQATSHAGLTTLKDAYVCQHRSCFGLK